MIREVPQRRGGTKYAVDQLTNPGTIVLRPSGEYLDEAIIAGMVGTVHADPNAKELYKVFLSLLRSQCQSKKATWVGRCALAAHARGVRLTTRVSLNEEYDLHF